MHVQEDLAACIPIRPIKAVADSADPASLQSSTLKAHLPQPGGTHLSGLLPTEVEHEPAQGHRAKGKGQRVKGKGQMRLSTHILHTQTRPLPPLDVRLASYLPLSKAASTMSYLKASSLYGSSGYSMRTWLYASPIDQLQSIC